MTSECDIVYLSRTPWDSLYQRPQHLAAGLAGLQRVLYVDTPRSTFNRRFLRPLLKRQPVRPLLSQPAPGLTVLSPAYVPFLPGRRIRVTSILSKLLPRAWCATTAWTIMR